MNKMLLCNLLKGLIKYVYCASTEVFLIGNIKVRLNFFYIRHLLTF